MNFIFYAKNCYLIKLLPNNLVAWTLMTREFSSIKEMTFRGETIEQYLSNNFALEIENCSVFNLSVLYAASEII